MSLTSVSKGKQGNDFNAPRVTNTLLQLFIVFLMMYLLVRWNRSAWLTEGSEGWSAKLHDI